MRKTNIGMKTDLNVESILQLWNPNIHCYALASREAIWIFAQQK